MLLRPSQIEFVENCVDAIETRGKTLGVAPTGFGKTVVFSAVIGQLINLYPKMKVCVIAHRDELTTQNSDKFKLVNPHITTSIFNSIEKSWDGQVTFAMVQTLSKKNNLDTLPRIDLLVIDEAHHATAQSYRDIIDKATDINEGLKLFGVTATPQRGDKSSLGEIFGNLGAQITIADLIASGHLVRPKTYIVKTGDTQERLQELRARYKGEISDIEEAGILNTVPLNSEVVKHWKEKAGDRKTVVFCSTTEHARDVTAAFQEQGIAASLLTCSAPKEERDFVLNNFYDGIIQVIVNVAILTEGWDFPPISCVVLLRSSSYKATMIQMIGRGLRTIDSEIYPDIVKLDCVVLDFGISSILHKTLEQDVDLAIKETREQVNRYGSTEESRIETKEKLKRIISDFSMEEIDLLSNSNFAWDDLRYDKVIGTTGFNSSCFIIKKDGIWLALGRHNNKNENQVIYQGGRLEAIAAANDFINRYEDSDSAKKNASWRKSRPSAAQICYLPPKLQKDSTLTKGEAAAIINYRFNVMNQFKRFRIQL